MLRFRPKEGVAVRGNRLRLADVLIAVVLPMLCFTVAFAIKEFRGVSWSKPSAVASQAGPSTGVGGAGLSDRIAPPSPLAARPTGSGARLTHIEDMAEEGLIARPASLSQEIRVAEEESSRHPEQSIPPARASLRAALHLGDQPLRTLQR
jgi:hypothetical protein